MMINLLNFNAHPYDLLHIAFAKGPKERLPLCEVIDGNLIRIDREKIVLQHQVTGETISYTRESFATAIRQKLGRDETVTFLELKVAKIGTLVKLI